MKLKSVRVENFRNILDSTTVEIQPDTTCLVGKNESGKSAFLNALYRLMPVNPNAKFLVQRHYPAWLEKLHKREGKVLEQTFPITAEFELEAADRLTIDEKFGSGTLIGTNVTVKRNYDNAPLYLFEVSEEHAARHLLSNLQIPPDFQSEAASAKSLSEIDKLLTSLKSNGGENYLKIHEALLNKRNETFGAATEAKPAVLEELKKLIPKFLYFDEYSALKGTIKIRELLTKDVNTLSEEERTAKSLLNLAGTDDQYLLNSEYEVRKRELENVATSITQDVLQYWTTNKELRVLIDLEKTNVVVPNGQQAVIDELKLRLWDDRHSLSLLLDERSTGFRWFFSFLAAFSEYEFTKEPLVILLDEPGLGLHARAQKDFLDFIEKRLSKRCQVIYSTHSPFLVQPGHLDRVRLVEDKGKEKGSIVTSDVMSIDGDTLFPLQAALGYDLAQHLFVAPHNLVVEGTSDFAYLMLLTDILNSIGRTGLDLRWSIVPVGGADLIPTFVALLGNHLDVTVLIDSRKEGNQKLANLVAADLLKKNKLIAIGNITKTKTADIEDLFDIEDYLHLYNAAFGASIKQSDLTGSDPIVSRIARFLGVTRFDHGKPADYFLRNRDKIGSSLKSETLNRFEELFKAINSTL